MLQTFTISQPSQLQLSVAPFLFYLCSVNFSRRVSKTKDRNQYYSFLGFDLGWKRWEWGVTVWKLRKQGLLQMESRRRGQCIGAFMLKMGWWKCLRISILPGNFSGIQMSVFLKLCWKKYQFWSNNYYVGLSVTVCISCCSVGRPSFFLCACMSSTMFSTNLFWRICA